MNKKCLFCLEKNAKYTAVVLEKKSHVDIAPEISVVPTTRLGTSESASRTVKSIVAVGGTVEWGAVSRIAGAAVLRATASSKAARVELIAIPTSDQRTLKIARVGCIRTHRVKE